MTIKQAFTVLAGINTLAKKMSEEDQKMLSVDMLEEVIKVHLKRVPSIQEQQGATADFFLELSRETTRDD
jgi:hypothetical protein